MKKPKLSAIIPYIDAGYDLIFLHKYNRIDKSGKERGKSPLGIDWRKQRYTTKQLKDHAKAGFNIGVRLRATDLVVDVDPRNFPEGDDVLERFVEDFDIDLSLYPHVITGSGGDHYYMTKPANIRVRDTLEDYPGIEFKSVGRQVVAAGSVHPNKRRYKWDQDCPEIFDTPSAPKHLLRIIERPALIATTGGGEFTPEEITEMLEGLDVTEYATNDEWMTIMMACHHASGGEARQEFIEWSTQDPEYMDDAWIIGRRWDSLHSKGNESGAITYKTLFKELHRNGAADLIPHQPVGDDFSDFEGEETEDDSWMEGGGDVTDDDTEKKSPLELMNDQFLFVDENGKFKIYMEAEDPSFDPPRKHWVRYTPYEFNIGYGDKRIQAGENTQKITEAWLNWTAKRRYKGIIFDPEKQYEGYLNLWRGWAVEPKKGDWGHLQELVAEVLCDGEIKAYEYVMNWAADMVQRPGQAAEVALCFQGEKGTGKGTFGRALAFLAGRHGMQITSPEHLTGRFNSHLRDVVCLFADEAISPYDQAANSRLKGLITEPTLNIEGKGADLVTTRNLVHVVMASNEDWFVPMSLADERRFFVSKVNNQRQGDHAFFDKLHQQLWKGGLQAMLWDLLRRDVTNWRPRQNIPVTAAAVEQKVRSLPPLAQWWFTLLIEGDLPFMHDGDWTDMFGVRVFRHDMRIAFEDFCRTNKINPGGMGRGNQHFFTQEIHKLCGAGFKAEMKLPIPEDRMDLKPHSDGRQWAYELPALEDCRDNMEMLLGGAYMWSKKNAR